MKDNSSRTGLGPTFQLAIEQLFPANERLLSDHTAFSVLPAFLRFFILLLKAKPVRNAYFDLLNKKAPGIYGDLLCRKRYITDGVAASANQGAISSVVIFGAGFDTLAYRIPELSSIKVFELDFPENIAGKKKRIEKIFGGIPDYVKLVPIDFNRRETDQVLLSAEYSFASVTFFVIEGVTQYITEDAFRRILSLLAHAKSGSRLIFTYILKDFIEGKSFYDLEDLYKRVRVVSQTWKLGFSPDEIGSILGQYNWNKTEDVGWEEYRERFIDPTGRKIDAMKIERAVFAEKL